LKYEWDTNGKAEEYIKELSRKMAEAFVINFIRGTLGKMIDFEQGFKAGVNHEQRRQYTQIEEN
jgi:hypothetical protein